MTTAYNEFINYAPSNYSNPYVSISNKFMPKSMAESFLLCEHTYKHFGIYRAAIDRISRIFFTNIKFPYASATKGLDEIKNFLLKNKKIESQIISIGVDYLVYGNCFLLLNLPFDRFVKCPKCNTEFPAKDIKDLNFKLDCCFYGTCNNGCGVVDFDYRNIPSVDTDRINIIRIPPQDIELIKNTFTGSMQAFWRIDKGTSEKTINGKGSVLISDTPVEMLKACFSGEKLELNMNEILILQMPNLAGQNIEYGMPFSISCFPIIYYINTLRKANEAIGSDYIMPLRVLFPSGTSSSEAPGPSSTYFTRAIEQILQEHKDDPLGWHIAPTQVGYQVIGGEKRALMVDDSLRQSLEELLNSMGFSPEYFYGTANLGATAMALRLLDKTHGLHGVYNVMLKWVVEKVCKHIAIDNIDVSLEPLQYMDDIERRNVLSTLASGQQLSQLTLYEQYGFDFEREYYRLTVEQPLLIDKINKQFEEKFKQTQQAQQNANVGGSGTPMDILAQAKQIAQQLLTLDEATRRQELKRIADANQLLHHAVRIQLEQQRNQLKTQGMNQILQQQRG